MKPTESWVTCPICGRKTKYRIRADTEAKRFPLWCHICKHESVVDVTQGKVKLSTTVKQQEEVANNEKAVY